MRQGIGKLTYAGQTVADDLVKRGGGEAGAMEE
jgi:hypothetical protein